jgi:RecA/RadA recombinase
MLATELSGLVIKSFQELNDATEKASETQSLSLGCPLLNKFMSPSGNNCDAAFEFNRLIELYGGSGSGKTQLALQTALHSVIDQKGKPKYKCFYVTTMKRVHDEKIKAFLSSVTNTYKLTPEQERMVKANLVEAHLTEISTFEQFFKGDVLHQMTEWEKNGSPLKLIVIDTITSIVKQLEGEQTMRYRKDKFMIEFYDSIKKLMRKGIHFLVINNYAANFRLGNDMYKKGPKDISALGDLWTYLVSDRFELMKTQNNPDEATKGSNNRLMRTHFSKNGLKQDAILEIIDTGMFFIG